MSSKKFTLRELIWYGFNYMVGVTFTAVFASLVWGKDKIVDGKIIHTGVGIHLLWIMALGGLVATGCAMCFAKLSRIHNADNGAAYIYTRTQLGKFMGWAISFLQYMCMPIIVISQITSMVRINFVDPTSILYVGDVLGHATNFVLDFAGILVYMLASMVIFLGLRLFKKMVKWAVILKWSSTLFLILAVLALLFINVFAKDSTNNFHTLIKDHSHLSVSLFATTFASTFFFYGGFETYITVGKNVEKPEKNIARSIIWVMFITTTFYLFVTTIFMGSFGVFYSANPNIQAFNILGGKWNIKWIGYIGTIIMLVCTISLKLQAGMQNALFSGAILEPQSREGFIPESLGVLDEENIARKANVFNLLLTAIFAVVWLLIPDAIQWFSPKHQAPFGYASITAQVGIIEMILYVTIVFICIKLAFEKKMKHHLFELIFWMFLFAFLIWQIFEFFTSIFNGINGTLGHFQKYADDQAATYFIELFYFLLIIIASVCIYKFYYLPKYHARMKSDPELQKKLDNEFTMVDDWAVISREIENYIDDYILRSKRVNLGYEFEYQETATKIKETIHNSEPDITFNSRAKKTLFIKDEK